MTTNPLLEFEELLRTHDWFYNYADDSRAYEAGRKESVAIRLALTNLENDGLKAEADALYEKYKRG